MFQKTSLFTALWRKSLKMSKWKSLRLIYELTGTYKIIFDPSGFHSIGDKWARTRDVMLSSFWSRCPSVLIQTLFTSCVLHSWGKDFFIYCHIRFRQEMIEIIGKTVADWPCIFYASIKAQYVRPWQAPEPKSFSSIWMCLKKWNNPFKYQTHWLNHQTALYFFTWKGAGEWKIKVRKETEGK